MWRSASYIRNFQSAGLSKGGICSLLKSKKVITANLYENTLLNVLQFCYQLKCYRIIRESNICIMDASPPSIWIFLNKRTDPQCHNSKINLHQLQVRNKEFHHKTKQKGLLNKWNNFKNWSCFIGEYLVTLKKNRILKGG